MSKQSSLTCSTRSSRTENGSFRGVLPKITTMDDVVTNFFNQMVQYVIEDMVVLEGTGEVEVASQKSEQIVKDYKELVAEDLVDAEIMSAEGSKITLTKRSSSEKKSSKTFVSTLDVIQEESEKTLTTKVSTASSSLKESFMDEELQVKIIFTNGNVYEGCISNRIMNGKGKYTWVDGTVYEGDFKDGFPTGKGKMTLPDLSHYEGEFNQGLFHGQGFLNIVATPTFYSGQWKNGHKHGQGWLLYGPGEWYEGGWADGLKEGFGLRFYKNGAKYRGMWHKGRYENRGIMIWENDDFYIGEWKNGLMDGEGEYIWKAFYNDTFTFPIQNTYKGFWKNGKRCGEGVMLFGDDSGLKLKGHWDRDFKHGDGYLVCGNGRVVALKALFKYDKPLQLESSSWSMRSAPFHGILDLPIFNAPEFVDVGFYVEKVIVKLQDAPFEKLRLFKIQEEKGIRNIITRYLPQLRELYHEYATIAAKTNLHFQPILIRLFLWQLYKDKEISKCDISLAQIDQLLADNPKSCIDTIHNPFEPIYFWQFLMSLISVALTTSSLDDLSNISSHLILNVIVKKFFDEIIFAKDNNKQKNTSLLDYLDLAPIKAVYRLYQKIGEPHSARTFLKESCTRKRELPFWCRYEIFSTNEESRFGTNLVPFNQHVAFEKHSGIQLDEALKRRWNNLYDLRHLGPKNVIRCLTKACPLIMSENLIIDIDYPLTFIEFYETLLSCIFMVLELEMKKEKKVLEQYVSPPRSPQTSRMRVSSSITAKKKITKEKKKGGKKKKK